VNKQIGAVGVDNAQIETAQISCCSCAGVDLGFVRAGSAARVSRCMWIGCSTHRSGSNGRRIDFSEPCPRRLVENLQREP
jgi:hypothetical protein